MFLLKGLSLVTHFCKADSQTKRFLRQTIVNIECSKNRWKTLIQSTENITVPHSMNSLWLINLQPSNEDDYRKSERLFNLQIEKRHLLIRANQKVRFPIPTYFTNSPKHWIRWISDIVQTKKNDHSFRPSKVPFPTVPLSESW